MLTFSSFYNRQLELISDLISERLKSALHVEAVKEEPLTDATEAGAANPQIITTEEELEAYLILKSILRKSVDVKRIVMRDAQSYCAILLDDNNRRPLCRFYFNGKKMSIGIPDEAKNFQKKDIIELDDIYNFSDELLAVADSYK